MPSEGTSVLLTFAGRKAFIAEILASSPIARRVLAVDADPDATIRWAVDDFRAVPPVTEEEAYVSALFAVCCEQAVDAVVAVNDMDLRVLARNAERFRAVGTRILGAPAGVVEILGDKLAVGPWLEARGFRYPETAEPRSRGARLRLPALAKARFGQGGRGQRACHTEEDVRALDDDFVIQELLAGNEYHLDVLRAADGEVKSVVPKRKLAMLHGYTDQAVSVEDAALLGLGARLGAAVGHVGSIDVDLMVAGGIPYVLDVNPRLGGGFPFTALVCPRYVDAFLEIAGGASPPPFLGEYRSGVTMHRTWRYCEVGARA